MTSSWDWRKNYRVWEASRKVFLYPENWIEPELRPSSPTQIQLDEVAKAARAQRASVLLTSAKPASTLTAGRALATALGRDLYRVGLTQVVSKYIGETEKNLERVFAAAQQSHAVLLFDEADALFGTRSESADSYDRFANAEITYLLKRIEAFEGVAMVTTNANRDTVAALLRRFAFVVDLSA